MLFWEQIQRGRCLVENMGEILYVCSYVHPSVPFSGSQTQDGAFLGSGPKGDNDLCIHTWGIFFSSIHTSQLEPPRVWLEPPRAWLRPSQGLDMAFLGPHQASLGLTWASWAWLRPPFAALRLGGVGWTDGWTYRRMDRQTDGGKENSPCVIG